MKLDIKKNNEGFEKKPDLKNDEQVMGVKFLEEVPLHEIAKTFSGFGQDGRVTVVPIGFPQAGKSMLLSSLFHYSLKVFLILTQPIHYGLLRL